MLVRKQKLLLKKKHKKNLPKLLLKNNIAYFLANTGIIFNFKEYGNAASYPYAELQKMAKETIFMKWAG